MFSFDILNLLYRGHETIKLYKGDSQIIQTPSTDSNYCKVIYTFFYPNYNRNTLNII